MPVSWASGECLVLTDRQANRAKEHEREKRKGGRKRDMRHRASVPMAAEVEVILAVSAEHGGAGKYSVLLGKG